MITEPKYFENKSVSIIGAGTAGVTAVLYILSLPRPLEIKWYYDSNKKPVSVGEGSQIDFPALLANSLTFNLSDVQTKLSGSLKMGIKKINWGGDEFVHDFIMPNHAIHFDANKTQDYILEKLVNEKITKIDTDISNVDIDSDFVIDCTGTPKDFKDYEILKNIPTNKAYVVQAEHNQENQTLLHTLCIARPFGWVFIVPLAKRYSIGYIFNGDITPDEHIKKDIEEVYKYIPVKPNIETGFINFNNYIKKENFTFNKTYCGNSSFFMEPLEATSQGNIHWIMKAFQSVMGQPELYSQMNSLYISHMKWSEMIINLHYLSGSKWNNDFWNEAYKKGLNSLERIKDDPYYKSWKNVVNNDQFDNLEYILDRSIRQAGVGQWNTVSWHINLKGLNMRNKLKKLL